jgi:hypothetical protein
MRNLLFFLLLFFSTGVTGQVRDKLLLSVQLHPQLTFHTNDYAFRSRPKSNVCSFGYGASANLHYELTNKIFASAGLGYNVQPINATVFLDQNQLPPPHWSPTQELVSPGSVSFRTVFLPLDISYRFTRKKESESQ